MRTPSVVKSGTPANDEMSLRWPSARQKLGCVAMSCTTSDVPVCTPAARVTWRRRGSGRPIICDPTTTSGSTAPPSRRNSPALPQSK
jgi:hypothetical protein